MTRSCSLDWAIAGSNAMERPDSRRIRMCSWMFTLVALFLGSAPLVDFVPNHALDRTWPDHARFHLALAASHLVTLSVLTILIAWFPFRNGRKWSWVALALVTVFDLGAFPLIGLGVAGRASVWTVLCERTSLLACSRSTRCLLGAHLPEIEAT